MDTTIHVPTPLRSCCAGNAHIHANAKTLGQAIETLVEQFPRLRRHLFDDTGQLRGYVNIFLNETELRDLAAGADTELGTGDTITILPSIAGG